MELAESKPDAVILCGGRATRLGGIDKPLRKLGDKPLLAHVLERLVPQTRGVVISANRNPETYAAFGHPVIEDGPWLDCGPLAGIAAGLARAASGFVAVVPGDAPRLPVDLVARLEAARSGRDADIACVHDGDGLQPLCVLIRRALLADLLAYLDGGGRAPRDWFDRHARVSVDFSHHPRMAWSINTPEEWRRAEHAAEKIPA